MYIIPIIVDRYPFISGQLKSKFSWPFMTIQGQISLTFGTYMKKITPLSQYPNGFCKVTGVSIPLYFKDDYSLGCEKLYVNFTGVNNFVRYFHWGRNIGAFFHQGPHPGEFELHRIYPPLLEKVLNFTDPKWLKIPFKIPMSNLRRNWQLMMRWMKTIEKAWITFNRLIIH